MEVQFIYNAKTGVVNSIIDVAHKLISPDTYECNLCKMTHDTFTENGKFKALKKKYNITLWHINEYEAKYKAEKNYPLIIIRDKNEKEINRIKTDKINNLNKVDDIEFLLDEISSKH